MAGCEGLLGVRARVKFVSSLILFDLIGCMGVCLDVLQAGFKVLVCVIDYSRFPVFAIWDW